MTVESAKAIRPSVAASGAFVILVAYVLSAGPAALVERKHIVNDKAFIVCWPLLCAVEATSLERPDCMYLHSWFPDIYDAHGDPIYGK